MLLVLNPCKPDTSLSASPRCAAAEQDPKACSVVLRGASKDSLNEVERNLQDAMGVARNVVADPRLVPGGGAAEMAVSRGLKDRAAAIQGARTSATNTD